MKNALAKIEQTPFGLEINKDAEGMISLTDIFKAAGSPSNKDPREWVRFDSTTQLLETVDGLLNVGLTHIIKSKKGKNGGTWAHKQIALAYAKYLDPKLHVAVNEIFFQRLEEEKDPSKILDRAVDTYKKHGKSDRWIDARLSGVMARKQFTSVLKAHLVTTPIGFKACTNAIYTPLWGGGAKVVRAKKGMEKGNAREEMTEIELTAVKLSELIAIQSIEDNALYGDIECAKACRCASQSIAKALVSHKKQLKSAA